MTPYSFHEHFRRIREELAADVNKFMFLSGIPAPSVEPDEKTALVITATPQSDYRTELLLVTTQAEEKR